MRFPVTLLAVGGLFVTAGCVDSSTQETGSATETVHMEISDSDICAARERDPLDCCEPPPGEPAQSGNSDPVLQSDPAASEYDSSVVVRDEN